MINASSAFMAELENDNRNYICDVNITLKTGEILSLGNEELWSGGISIEESVSNDSSFDIGSTIINKATIVINNIYENYTSHDFTGAKATIKVGLKLSDGTVELLNKGIFYVDSASYNGAIITLECLDSMSKFDKDYSLSTLHYPASLMQIVQDACDKCDVLYSAARFDNDDFVVEERPEEESLTFRQVLNYVGQIACQQFSIDHNNRLVARWYNRNILDDLYANGNADGDYHIISAINASNIDVDDVVITGVKVTEFSNESDNPGGTYLSGSEGYVINIKENKLIQIGFGSEVADYLGNRLVGMRFRPMELTFQNNPTIEPTDAAEVVDYKGNHYYTFVTSTTFTVGNSQTLSCGAESATRNSASRYSASTQAYANSKILIEKERTEREKAIDALNEALSSSSGMYITEEKQDDGSVITYLHDSRVLSESQNIIKITSEAIGISNDGGKTYPYGIFLTGDLIARLLYAVGINADYINSGAITVKDQNEEITFFADTVTGRVEIKAQSLTITGKTVQEIAEEQSDSAINDFVDAVYNPGIENLQAQIDGQIETWFYSYVPTTSNYPASEWTTDTEKDKHLGDLFYIVDNAQYGGQAYRWAKIGTDYLWDYVEDTAVVKALADAAAAQDTADQKRRVFVTTPTPPYDVGDLWVGNDTSDLMRCKRSRSSGNYDASDWIKAVKYTDNTELYNFVQNDYNTTIQEIYQSVDQKSETWYQDTDPSLQWTDTESDPLQDTTGASIFDTTGATIVTIYESEKALHDGDLWHDTTNNKEYIYVDGEWQETSIPDDVLDIIDGKAQIFVSTPTPPYAIGDLWFNGATSDIMTCINSRDNGSYNAGDWQKRNKYTDDTAVNKLDESLNQQEVFDRLTNGGTAQGIYMENGQLYILFSYAKGGVLQLGGLENEFGELSLLDDSKNKLVSLSNKGMVIYSADSGKQIGKIGANRYSDGREFISTEVFPESSGIEWNRIDSNGKPRILFRYNISEKKEEEKFDLYVPFSIARNNWNSKREFLPVITSNVGNLSIKERNDIAHSGYISIFLNETGYTGQRRDLNWFVVKENSENYAGMGFLQIYPGFMRIEDLYDSDALLLGNDINMNRHQILNQSDERVKNNITEYNESAIEIINEIGIYEYDWIESGIHEDAGFIAQQLESIIPNAVKINKLGESYSVLPIKIIPYLVKSVQELSKEIELLKKEICELKGETYISKESKKDKWKPSDMSLEEKREFIKSLKRAERRE